MNDTAGHDSSHRAALEIPAIEWRIARFAARLVHRVGPSSIQLKKRQVGGLSCGNLTLDSENLRRARCEQFDHAH